MSLGLILCHLMTGTVEYLLCERNRHVDTRFVENSTGKWGKVWGWRLLANVRRHLQVPQCSVMTSMRPDMVLYSECGCILYFVEDSL